MSDAPHDPPPRPGEEVHPADGKSRSIRVRVLDRDYPLRVAPADEAYTLHLAKYVDGRLRQIRAAVPHQPDLTHAVIGTLEMAEELFAARAEIDRLRARIEVEAGELARVLDGVLDPPLGDGAPGDAPDPDDTPDEEG